MENEKNNQVSRKKFFLWGIGLFSAFTAGRYFFRFAPKRKKKMTTMLTQDGKLVEIDITKISAKRKKISDEDIHTWVKRKSSL